MVVLGDPGSGKSTLINYLTTTLASRQRHPLASALGPLIPVPIVLRDFEIPPDISFDGLLDQLLAQPFWSGHLGREDLIGVLESGQALVMLDGLDEIGDLNRRRGLRRAILEQGVGRFPRSTWIVTSRMIGYDEVPFDLPRLGVELSGSQGPVGLETLLVPSAVGGASVGVATPLYILPFTMDQIRRFAENWYALREADAAEQARGVESLMAAIASSQSIEGLAHTPNLLTMMALIHRVYAQLPSGRALLYDRIAEAYLESIDTYRGIRETSVPLALQQRWLGELAFEMQRERPHPRLMPLKSSFRSSVWNRRSSAPLAPTMTPTASLATSAAVPVCSCRANRASTASCTSPFRNILPPATCTSDSWASTAAKRRKRRL